MNRRQIECFAYVDSQRNRGAREGIGLAISLLEQPKWANALLIEQFVHLLDGGEPIETNVEDNLQSAALVFAGIESSRSKMPVNVQEHLLRAAAQVG